MIQFLVFCLFFGIIFGVICLGLGRDREVGSTAGFWWGFFLGFIGLIIVLYSPKIQQQQPRLNTQSIPDQLKKYKELLDSGAITEQEYNIQKARLLNY